MTIRSQRIINTNIVSSPSMPPVPVNRPKLRKSSRPSPCLVSS
uniref:Uncharacterized protein n=1 Tax=Romanomermis culicivorax TaxID=13658 RepID=A0A915L2W1_ROMCU